MPDNNQNPNPNPTNPQYYPNQNPGGYPPGFAPGGNPSPNPDPNSNYYAVPAAPINPQYDYGNPNYGQPNADQNMGQIPQDNANPYAYPDNLNYNSTDPNQQNDLAYNQQPAAYDPNNPYAYPEYTTPDYSAANNNPAPDYDTNYDANYTQDYTQNPPGQDQNLDPNNPNNNYQDYTAAPNPDQNPGNGSQGDNQNPQNPGEGKNTFEEKKSGNRLFFIISGIVIVLLLIATGFLSWYSLSGRQAQDATNSDSSQSVNENFSQAPSSQDSSQQINSSPTSLSGSSQASQLPQQAFSSTATFSQAISADFTNPSGPTPAEVAKVNDATTLASDWIVQKFTGSDLSPDGTCRNTLRCGGSADPDRDGLVNTEEYNYQTDPLNSDTDSDGFADGDETNAYATNPNARDSDGDGYADGDEILACQNPALKNGQIKMDQNKLAQIKSALQLEPLQETSIATFNKFGASSSDIANGYLQASCGGVPGTGASQQQGGGNVVLN